MESDTAKAELATLIGGPRDGQLVSARPTLRGSVVIDTADNRKVVYTRRRPTRKRVDGSVTYDFVGWI